MRRLAGLRAAAIVSVLGLLVAACGSADGEEPPASSAEQTTEVEDAGSAAEQQTVDPEAPPTDAEEAAESAEQGVAEAAEPGSVTAYVVGYHWGWALFDEDGTELERLEVPVGTEVELVAVNDHAGHAIDQLPDAVAETIRSISFHDRAHHDVEMGRIPDPEVEEGVSLAEALAVAHDGHDHMGPTQDHGLMVAGIGVEAFLDAHGDEPARLVFTVEEEGVHQFRCTEECGVGHENQRWDMLVVSA